MTADDPNLLQRFAAGDRAALEELLQAHLSDLRGFVRLRVGPELRAKESASDLVQSVCRQILEQRERFQFPGENGFRRWLFATALRTVRQRARRWRAEKRDPGREVSLEGAPAPRGDELVTCYASVCTPSQEVGARENVERIERAFDQLPEDYREVISLARLAGLPHAQVAEQMGRSEGATRVLLSRALARLSELLVQ